MPCRSSSDSVLRAPATTCAPSPASSRATARPMPLLAPVTTATLPVSSRSIGATLRPARTPGYPLKAASGLLRNPASHHRAVPLSFEQFRYGFANAVSEQEAHDLYETFAVPGSGTPIFQAAT